MTGVMQAMTMTESTRAGCRIFIEVSFLFEFAALVLTRFAGIQFSTPRASSVTWPRGCVANERAAPRPTPISGTWLPEMPHSVGHVAAVARPRAAPRRTPISGAIGYEKCLTAFAVGAGSLHSRLTPPSAECENGG